MRRLFAIGLSGLFQVAAVGAAVSADMPVKAPPAPLVPVIDWTGFYVGGSAGAGFTNKTFINNFPTPDGIVDGTPHPTSWVGGLQAGYNYQINSILLGLEGDFTWSGAREKFSCFTFGAQTCTANPEWIGAVTGRLGAVFGPTLFYVKGGPAWAGDSYSDVASTAAIRVGIPSLPGDMFHGMQITPGWTVGGGIEYQLSYNWWFRLEYDHYAFPDKSVRFDDGLGNSFTELIQEKTQLVTVGVDYRFGAAAVAPVPVPFLTKASSADDSSDSDKHVLAFTGADFAKYSVDSWAGALIAPLTDLDTSGLRVWIFGDGGAYKYFGSGTAFHGVNTGADFLAGYGFEGDNYSINLLAGGNVINQWVSPFDPDNPAQGTEGGAKVRGDAYINPTPQTLSYTEAEYSTAFGTYYLNQKLGYDITNGQQVFVGPQATWFGDSHFHQWRVGGHVSNMTFGRLQIDVSAGFADDSVVGRSAYTTVELNTQF